MIVLKLLRQIRGKSQWQLGIEAMVPNYKLSQFECGKLEPTPDELQRLARALGTTPDNLRSKVTEEVLLQGLAGSGKTAR